MIFNEFLFQGDLFKDSCEGTLITTELIND